MVLKQSCHETQLVNTLTKIINWLSMNVTLMVMISLVCADSHLHLECSYLHVLCGTTYILHSSQSMEKKISVVCQNINKNDCQSHLFVPPHCITSCQTCTCGCLSILYFLHVILLFEILNLNIFGLNELIFVMALSTYQQDQISKYKKLTIRLKNSPQNVVNGLYVSSLSSKFDTIVLFASIVSCASIVVSFVSYVLEYVQVYLNYVSK